MAAANGFGRVLVGRGGILSTPAASCVIRKRAAFGGIILSASHNPGGPDGDFGIKYNTGNGGPAPERVTEAICAQQRAIDALPHARRARRRPRPRSACTTLGDDDGRGHRSGRRLRRADGDAVRLRRDRARCFAAARFRMRFDAMHAVTGPYARRDLRSAGSARRPAAWSTATPLPDFGGGHPDPNPIYARRPGRRRCSAPTRPTSAPRPTATATAT